MLKEKVIEWIGKTFGKPQHGDMLEMTCKASDATNKQGAKIFVEEISFIFQRRKSNPSEVDVKKWKKELDEITGNKLRDFHFGNQDLYAIANEVDIKRGSLEGELVRGRATILTVSIHKQTFISHGILFPSKIGSNRRH